MKTIVEDYLHYRYFLKENVARGIKVKYRNSYLGIIWTLIEPLLVMMVLSFVFGTLFGNDDPTFPVYILTGRLLYGYFAGSTRSCVKAIRANSGMIKKVYVPKYFYPLSGILSNYVTFIISMIVLVGVCLYYKVYPSIYTPLAVVPLFVLLLLSIGIGLILSVVGVFFKDMEYLWGIALMLVMYTCAIFYKISRFEASGKAWVLQFNPLYCIIKNFRNCILYAKPLEMSTMLYAVGFSVVSIIIGSILFYKKQDEFILHI